MGICNLDSDGFCARHKTKHIGRLLELSQMDNELGEQYRDLWDRMATPGLDPVSRAEQVKKFSNDLTEFIRLGMPKVDDDMYATRIAACDVCPHVDKSIETWRCKLCGCNLKEGPILPGRARWATKDCPDPEGSHWPKVELPVLKVVAPKGGCCKG